MKIDKFITKTKSGIYIFKCPNCEEFSTSSLYEKQIRNSGLKHMESKNCIWNSGKKRYDSGNIKTKKEFV